MSKIDSLNFLKDSYINGKPASQPATDQIIGNKQVTIEVSIVKEQDNVFSLAIQLERATQLLSFCRFLRHTLFHFESLRVLSNDDAVVTFQRHVVIQRKNDSGITGCQMFSID